MSSRTGLALALATVTVLAGCAAGGTPAAGNSSTGPRTSAFGGPGSQSAPSTPAAPSTTSPDTNVIRPLGVSFLTAATGWALGSVGDGSSAALAVTTSAGAYWTRLPDPPASLNLSDSGGSASVDNVYFADRNDGYLYGPGLFATHDAGLHWSHLSLGGRVLQVLGNGQQVYALIDHHGHPDQLTLRCSRVGADTWTAVPLPTKRQGLTLAASASTIALLAPGSLGPQPSTNHGQLWSSLDAGNTWQRRTVPCTESDGGAALLAVASSNPADWAIDCFLSLQAEQYTQSRHRLYASTDGGRSWTRQPNPPQTGAPVLLAINGAGSDLLAVDGADDSMAAKTSLAPWHGAVSSDGNFQGWADLTFATAHTAYIVGPIERGSAYTPGHLHASTDSGAHWHDITITTSSSPPP